VHGGTHDHCSIHNNAADSNFVVHDGGSNNIERFNARAYHPRAGGLDLLACQYNVHGIDHNVRGLHHNFPCAISAADNSSGDRPPGADDYSFSALPCKFGVAVGGAEQHARRLCVPGRVHRISWNRRDVCGLPCRSVQGFKRRRVLLELSCRQSVTGRRSPSQHYLWILLGWDILGIRRVDSVRTLQCGDVHAIKSGDDMRVLPRHHVFTFCWGN
jgi:hypothetical protein